MPPLTLTTTANVTETAVSQNKQAGVRRAAFGDGYSQRSPAGINSVGRTVPLTFEGSASEIDAIDAFLTARKGVESFYYDFKGKFTGALFTCENWQKPFVTNDHGRLTATFRQEFDIS